MAEKIRISTPPSSAGILKFYDAEGGGIKIDPSAVIVASVIFIVLILILRFFQ